MLKFVNREKSVVALFASLVINHLVASGPPGKFGARNKTELPVAAQNVGQGKTYLGENFQARLKMMKEDHKFKTMLGLPHNNDVANAVVEAHYIRIEPQELKGTGMEEALKHAILGGVESIVESDVPPRLRLSNTLEAILCNLKGGRGLFLHFDEVAELSNKLTLLDIGWKGDFSDPNIRSDVLYSFWNELICIMKSVKNVFVYVSGKHSGLPMLGYGFGNSKGHVKHLLLEPFSVDDVVEILQSPKRQTGDDQVSISEEFFEVNPDEKATLEAIARPLVQLAGGVPRLIAYGLKGLYERDIPVRDFEAGGYRAFTKLITSEIKEAPEVKSGPWGYPTDWEESADAAMTLMALEQRVFPTEAVVAVKYQGETRKVPVLHLASDLGMYCLPVDGGPATFVELDPDKQFRLFIPPIFIPRAFERVKRLPGWMNMANTLNTMDDEIRRGLAPGQELEWKTRSWLIHTLAIALASSSEASNVPPTLGDIFSTCGSDDFMSSEAAKTSVSVDLSVPSTKMVQYVGQVAKRVPETKKHVAYWSTSYIPGHLARDLRSFLHSSTIVQPAERSSSPDLIFLAADEHRVALVGIQVKDHKRAVPKEAVEQHRGDFHVILEEFRSELKSKNDKRPVHGVAVLLTKNGATMPEGAAPRSFQEVVVLHSQLFEEGPEELQ